MHIKIISSKKNISASKVDMVYIGTVVGAGFASGQEILHFFGYFGLWGIAGTGAVRDYDAGRPVK